MAARGEPVLGKRRIAGEKVKTFDNEWIFQAFEDQASFFTKRMFSGLAAYLFGRMMMVLMEPAKTGRWKWHGVLICTEYAHQASIVEQFPQLAPHDVLRKWLYIDTRHDEFERTMQQVTEAMALGDARFGIHPRAKKERAKPRSRAKSRQPRRRRE